MNPVESLISVGRIVQSRGIHGEVVVFPLSDDPSRFNTFDRVIGVDKKGDRMQLAIQNVDLRTRHGRPEVLLRFEGIDSRTASDTLKGIELFVDQTALPLEEDEYFLFDLQGIDVVTSTGERLGTITEVRRMPAQDLFVVDRGAGEEVLIPDVDVFVDKSQLAEGKLIVHPIDGLLEI